MRAFSLRDAPLYCLVTLASCSVFAFSNTGRAQQPPPPAVPAAAAAPAPGPDVNTSSQPAELGPAAPAPGTPSEPEPTPAPAPPPPPTAAEPPAPNLPIRVEFGGGMILLYRQPLERPDGGSTRNLFEIFEARLRMDAYFDRYQIHITPRFRDTKERGFFPGESWVEEAWAGANFGPTILKVGKIYAKFGKFWDNSFYGNVQEYDGFKLDLNHGLSYEGTLNETEKFGLNFALQYFVIDGTTNYALPLRDTHTYANSHRRNQVIARAAPFINFNDNTRLTLGLSATYFQADLPQLGDRRNVNRIAVDATFTMGGLGLWAEYTHQAGRHVIDFPSPGASSNDNHYTMLGGEYAWRFLTFRYNFNMGVYSEVEYTEWRSVPGISATLSEHLIVLLEWAYAKGSVSGGSSTLVDNALYTTIHGKF